MRAKSRSGAIARVASVFTAYAAFAFAPALAADPADHRDDPERIARLSADVARGDFEAQQAARAELISDFGAYAVSGLLRYIGRSADVEERVNAIFTLRRLGSEATLAMLAAFATDDAVARRNLCQVFGAVGDDRAAPTLACAAEHDGDPLVRTEAVRALDAMGQGAGDGVGRLVDLAGRFLAGAGLAPGEPDNRVFFWDGRRVSNRDLPDGLGPAAYALLTAERALMVDSGHGGAIEAYLAAAAELRNGFFEAGEDEWEAEITSLDTLLHLGGVGPEPEAPEPFDPSEVEGAPGTLESQDKRLRYNKALLDYASATPRVVEVLAQALSESAIRHILVVDPDPEERNALVASLTGPDRFAVGAATGAQGLMRAKATPVKDVIVLRSSIRDIPVDRVVLSLKRDYRTEDVPVIVIARESEVDALETALGDDVLAVVPSASPSVLEPALASAFDRVALNDQRLSAETVAAQAARALASLDGDALAPAADALVAAIDRSDEIRIPALWALAKLGAAAGQAPAARLLSDESASTEARVGAAHALAGILERHPMLPGTEAILRRSLESEDLPVRNAAARALGHARSLSPAERGELLLSRAFSF